MERVVEELEVLASHWDYHGVPSVGDLSGQDDRQRPPSENTSR